MDVDTINNIINFSINKDCFRGLVTDFLNMESYNIKNSSLLYDFVKDFNENIVNDKFDADLEAKKYINYIALENDIYDRELGTNEEISANKTYLFNNMGIIVRNKNVKLWIEDLQKIITMCDDTKFNSPI